MSNHKLQVVQIVLEPHPGSDYLSLVRVGGYQVVVQTANWVTGQLGVLIPPESLVDTTLPHFSWLNRGDNRPARIKVKKLKGEVSMGLLVPAPEGFQVGEIEAETFGVGHYNPPELKNAASGGEVEPTPLLLRSWPVYDLESLRRYPDILQVGELVQVTEKLHGANSRYCFHDGRMWCGSHREWKRQDDSKLWWATLAQYPRIELLCRACPDHVLYGEIYGCVQSLRYGHRRGATSFAAFDLQDPSLAFLPVQEFCEILDHFKVSRVPVLADNLPYSFQDVEELAEGTSWAFLGVEAPHVREGCVVKPLVERTVPEIGRVCLKLHGVGYLALKK